jgi:hypothetical protein
MGGRIGETAANRLDTNGRRTDRGSCRQEAKSGVWQHILGTALIVASVLMGASLGLLAVVAAIVLQWRRRRTPPMRTSLPPGWRVIVGGKPEDPSSRTSTVPMHPRRRRS